MSIHSGLQAPDFSLLDENGREVSLSKYRGIPVVIYFYPKDDTPGCIKEACNFRDDYKAYVDAGVVILGISPDNPKAHRKFKTKYNLPFSLLADTDKKICLLYDVWRTKKLMGREYEGVVRTTFLIDARGRIAKVFDNVKPSEHSEEVLGAIRSL
jgi:thioredoxin-dependent peroxiredoxin